MSDQRFTLRDLASDACLAHDAVRSVDQMLSRGAFKHTDLPQLLGVRQVVTELRDEAETCLRVLDNLIEASREAK